MHVIFYDGECPLCHRAVRFVLAADRKKQFYFAPLKGETAKKELSELRLENPDLDTLVLLQNYQSGDKKIEIEGRGALRILWLLGGKYALVGWLSFLPSVLFDAVYRLIARYRFHLFSTKVDLLHRDERFLE